jgi:hypothetical protein
LLIHTTQSIFAYQSQGNVIMELFKKIALVVGAFVIAGFILRIIFGILGAIFSIKGLLLIAAIGIPIYLIAEKKFLR